MDYRLCFSKKGVDLKSYTLSVIVHVVSVETYFLHYNIYTPGIYAEGYMVFALTFVRSYVRSCVRSFVRSFVTFRNGRRIYLKVFG